MPFEIPDNWEWCKITEIAETLLGKTLDRDKDKGNFVKYLCAVNVQWGKFDLSIQKQFRIEDKDMERYSVIKGDLLVCEGGDVGRSAIWENDCITFYQNALHRLRFKRDIKQYFYLYTLMYYKSKGYIDDVCKGVTIKHFTQNAMQSLWFPLPPLAEQQRIIVEVERWFALIEQIEQDKADLQVTIKQTKSKILDLAIHGKLVPQDPNDEPASELLKRINPKAEITSDNEHYENLPRTWCICKLNAVVNIVNGKTQKEVKDVNGVYPIYGSGGIIGYAKEYLCLSGSTIIGRKGTINNPILVNENFWNVDTAFGMKPIDIVDDAYFFYFCQSFDFSQLDKSTALPSLTKTVIGNLLLPVPPYNEQKRIVTVIRRYEQILNTIEESL